MITSRQRALDLNWGPIGKWVVAGGAGKFLW